MLMLGACRGEEIPSLTPGVHLSLGPTATCEDLSLSTEVAKPHSHSPSRFLNGWWPDHDRKGWLRAPSGKASIALATDGGAGLLVLATDAKGLEVTLDGHSLPAIEGEGRVRIGWPESAPGTHFVELQGEGVFSVEGARFLPSQEPTEQVVECYLALDASQASTFEVVATPGYRWSLWDSAAAEPAKEPRLTSEGGTRQSFTIENEPWPRLRLRSEPGAAVSLTLDGAEFGIQNATEVVTPRGQEISSGSQVLSGKPPRLVLVYVMDALRADAVQQLGPGSTWSTLANSGLSYSQHRSVAPNTLPSTKALHVGRVWTQQGGYSLAEEETTLAELFREAGYRTGLFSNNPWVNAEYGLGQGFDIAAEASAEEVSPHYFDDAERLHQAALEWVKGLPQEEPVFLYIHVLHPHNPYKPPMRLVEEHCSGIPSSMNGSTETLTEIRGGKLRPNTDDKQRVRCLYQTSLEYADQQFGGFLEELREGFEDQETLVIATSDHGEELFEHRGVLHGYTLFEEMIRIPLVIWAPGRVEKGKVDRLTSTLDVHRFLAATARQTGEALAPGSLPLTSGKPAPVGTASIGSVPGQTFGEHFAAAASVKGGIVSLQGERWKVVWAPRRGRAWGQGQGTGRRRDSVEVFDLRKDPMETRPLPPWSHAEPLWLLSRLRQRLREPELTGSPTAAGATEPEIDESMRRRLKSLGYTN